MSRSLLSQVETGKVQRSVSTLWAIVTGLGLSVDDVLPDARPASAAPRSSTARGEPVQPREDAPELTMNNVVPWRGLAVAGSAPDVDGAPVTSETRGGSTGPGKHQPRQAQVEAEG